MTWTIIVASSDEDQLAELKQGAEEINIRSSGGSASVLEATSVEDIKRLRSGPHDSRTELIIVTALLAESRSAPNYQNLPGLNLVIELQAGPLPPACILISERVEHISEVQRMARCKLLVVNASTAYLDDCVQLAKELDVWPPPKQPQAPPHAPDLPAATSGSVPQAVLVAETYALVEVEIPSDAKSATVRRVVKHPNRTNTTPATPLGLDQRKVNALVDESRKLSEKFAKAVKSRKAYEDWQTDYRSLGERIFKLFDTKAFVDHLSYAKGAADSHGQDVRLRFSLGRAVYDGLWESIFDPTAGRHLMLDSTITRRDRDSIDDFADGGGGDVGILNVLVIGSTVKRNSEPDGPDDALWRRSGAGIRLEALPHLDTEVATLSALQGAPGGPAALKIKVDVLSGTDMKRANKDKKPWSLAEIVEQRLEKEPKRYDVIHFAGHALFSAERRKRGAVAGRRRIVADERGYLVFSGFPNARAVPIATVASWLKDTSVELFYLSCCRSSAAQTAAEFARNSIRTTLGFRWDLDDNKAVHFAKFFYEGLLGNRLNVCSAIREARGKLYNDHDAGDPIWASPVLLAQPQEWRYVEGVLRPPVRP